jgi:GTP-binding protein HflX
VPELVVVNKADAADPLAIKALRLAERGSVVVSARAGTGLDDLLARIEEVLPRRDAEVSALVPYGRSDLVARAHREGEVLEVAHCAEGTQLTARVPPDLAAQLAGAAGVASATAEPA